MTRRRHANARGGTAAPGGHSLDALLAALDSGEPSVQRRAGDQLLARGEEAIPHLLATLHDGPANARKAAAHLLGRVPATPEVRAGLCRALAQDAEPKVRKNAAVSLGRHRAEDVAEHLAGALSRETVPWVRVSMVLALGAMGGDRARAALDALEPADETEAEAARKALDRLTPGGRDVAWRTDVPWQRDVLIEAPVGLEEIAAAEALEKGVGRLAMVGPGRLVAPRGVPPWSIVPALRCVHAVSVRLAQGPSLPEGNGEEVRAAVLGLLHRSALRGVRELLHTDNDSIRFRFALQGTRLGREDLGRLLRGVREVCRPLGLVDSPSNYGVELIVADHRSGAELLLVPGFAGDERFAYRREDVGAAVNPVIAACLARLVRTPTGGVLFDPTCGSGSLLVERALLGGIERAVGLDVSPTAVRAARTNVGAAGLVGRVRVSRGDARDPERWPECDEVVANLPFGVRTRRGSEDIRGLYDRVIANLAGHLRPGGRAVLYTASRRALDAALARHKERLRIVRRLRTRSGGLDVGVWVLSSGD